MVMLASRRDYHAMKHKPLRDRRINVLAEKLARRYRESQARQKVKKRPLYRAHVTEPQMGAHKIIAYDLETTSIRAGTPTPCYMTACGADYWFSGAIRSTEHLLEILETRFLTTELIGARYVAWNGNHFDAYFIAAALLHEPRFLVRPYLTRTKSLRGLRVALRDDDNIAWEFLDGIAMLGMQGVKLSKFLESFAPTHLKMTETINFEKEEFDSNNPEHVKYAERDSEGLFVGLMKAQEIVYENFNVGLSPTIGNMGIRIFKNHMPYGVTCYQPSLKTIRIIRDYVMRGGFCFCSGRYEGPVWKYDINQAYAAAMREAWLPAGKATKIKGESKYGNCSISKVTVDFTRNRVPFYLRINHSVGGELRPKSIYAMQGKITTWITSVELAQLRAEKLHCHVHESIAWESEFTMREYVDKLEHLRINAPGGPKSASGQMMKYIGNNSYGKTVEELDGLELVMSNEQPEGFHEYFAEEDYLQHVWFRFGEPQERDYHQPQIGAFITAHVRMVLRRGILLAPKQWLYADTDCLMFSKPVKLDIDPNRYGAWKQEAAGEHYRLITKKVYADVAGETRHAKGVNVNRLTNDDFINWYNGKPPTQKQVQRQNFVRVMSGMDMFIERTKVGQRI